MVKKRRGGRAVTGGRKAPQAAHRRTKRAAAQPLLAGIGASEKTLVRERENLQAIFDVVNVALLLIDPNGYVKRVNDTVSRWVGEAPSACQGKQPGDFLRCVHAIADPAGCGHAPACASCAVRNTFESVLRTGQPVHDVEAEASLAIGGKEVHLWLKASADPLILDGKRHVILALNNTSAHKRMEEELAKLASFPLLNPNPIVEADLEGRVSFTNPSAQRLFPDLQQRGLDHPWLVDWQSVADVCRTTDPILPSREVTVDGRWFHQALHFVPETRRVRIYGLDITERKEAEQALRESQADLNRAQSVAHSGSWRLNLRHNELCWSEETHRMFGIPEGTPMTYEAFLATVHPDDREYVHQKWTAALGGQPYDIEHRIIVGDTVKWVREKAELEFDQGGFLLGGFGTVQDITERKRMEQALYESEAGLREADRRKNEFLAVLSHELRNPLAPIKSSLYILDHAEPGGDQARRAQSVMERQVNQLCHLVDDLLDVTRISQGRIRLQRQRLDFCDLVRRTLEDHRSLFEQNGVRLELELAPEPVFVNGDATRLAQVVGNLLQNAAKFTGRQGTTHVSVLPDLAEQRAMLRVLDTGVGMTPETVSLLFRPFMQADMTLDRSQGGLGLGLALVKGLVELHGGDIRARSAGIGKGSEFVLRLPLEEAQTADAHAVSARPVCRSRRVLIIEDNVDAADSLRDVLEFSGHEVAVAYSGPDGLARARECHPEVVLCDIGLPEMDGYAVARAFRSDDVLKGAVLVALTGYALPEDLKQAAEAGFEGHIAKPPDFDKLQKLLESTRVEAPKTSDATTGETPSSP